MGELETYVERHLEVPCPILEKKGGLAPLHVEPRFSSQSGFGETKVNRASHSNRNRVGSRRSQVHFSEPEQVRGSVALVKIGVYLHREAQSRKAIFASPDSP